MHYSVHKCKTKSEAHSTRCVHVCGDWSPKLFPVGHVIRDVGSPSYLSIRYRRPAVAFETVVC